MDIGTIIGIVGAIAFVILGIVWGGQVQNLGNFYDMSSVLIVLGGTLMASIASYPLKTIMTLPKIIGKAFKTQQTDLNDDIDLIIKIANVARREGLLSLENQIAEMDNPFLKKGIMLIVDGSDPELIKNIMQTELVFISERHSSAHAMLDQMGAYAPAFGMIGTLIGLINMLKQLDDPDALGPGMAVALVTTFYGSFLSNVVFTPLSKKLAAYSSHEYLQKELLLEGMLSIQDGENPRIIKDKLTAFIARGSIRPETDEAPRAETAEVEE